MANDIPAALIGAMGGMAAAAVPFALKALANRRGRYLSPRGDSLLARWEGAGRDYYVEDESKTRLTFDAVMTFTSLSRLVKGEAVIRDPKAPNQEDHLVLSGTFFDDDYLQLSYYNKTFIKKQLGVLVLRLGPNGDVLRGYYTGFSPRRGTIVSGMVELKRKV